MYRRQEAHRSRILAATRDRCASFLGTSYGLSFLNGVVVHLTYTERGDDLHVISLRKAAEKHEIRYFA